MADLTLCIGTKNISSWSLRAWMALARTGVRFDEVVIALNQPDTKERILAYSPSGKVPVLRHGETVIWESLAICEYINELFPDAQLWPENREARAVARSVSAEMHAGFAEMRKEMPMDVLGRHGKKTLGASATRDVERVLTLWRTCRARYGQDGPFLFSSFSIADCMFAPVVTRFVTYDVAVDTPTRAYLEAMLATPEMVRWTAEAQADLDAAAAP
jgi:glutathione S-transferase